MKKRRVWWMVGSLVVAVALFAAVAFLSGYNSTDARIERAVAQIVEEYGFELERQESGHRGLPQGDVIGDLHCRASLDADSSDEIMARLSAACPAWEYRNSVVGQFGIQPPRPYTQGVRKKPRDWSIVGERNQLGKRHTPTDRALL